VVPRVRVRWVIFGFLFAFTFAAYVQRTAISVASVRMMPELGLSQLQIGWLETAFLVTYTALQFPGGVLGQFVGMSRMMTLCGALAVAATLAVPVLPAVAAGGVLFGVLLLAQLVLGVAQAPLFGLVTGLLERWFPPQQWALTQGATSAGMGLGAAAAPAAIAALMVSVGWRAALVIVALPVVALVAMWWRYGRDAPWLHPDVSQAEFSEVGTRAEDVSVVVPTWARMRALLLNRDMAALAVSYLAMNVVFYLITYWSFLYLVQARHFGVLDGGMAASVPSIGGAVGAWVGGVAGSRLTRRLGARAGLRVVPLVTLPLAGVLLLASVHVDSAVAALGGLALALGFLEMNEGCFWAAAMEIGGVDAVAAGGILNTGGNVGGIVATPLVAWLSGGGNWTTPFVLGAGCAALSAGLWLVIQPMRPGVRHWGPGPKAPAGVRGAEPPGIF
jgi:sugar phosphate permease